MKRYGLMFVLIALLVLAFAMPVSAEVEPSALYFKDVPQGIWYDNFVYQLASEGIINGYGGNEFRPNNNITRAEFVTMLARMGKEDCSSYANLSAFDDSQTHWAKEYINWAYVNGVVNGMGNGNFAPDAKITREQLCTMMMNYARYSDYYPKKVKSPISFDDDAHISPWARGSVFHMQRADILAGKGQNNFDPQGYATRAECAKVFYYYKYNTQDDFMARELISDYYLVANYYGTGCNYFLADYTHDGYDDLIVTYRDEYNDWYIDIYSSLGGDIYLVYTDSFGPYALEETYYLYETVNGAYLMHYLCDSATGMTEQGLEIFHGDYNGAQEFMCNDYVIYDIYWDKVPSQFYTNQNTYKAFKPKSMFLFGSIQNEMRWTSQSYEKALGKWGF
ncbi:MAG: S-layer homology domain-containing protein [Firmicutes bacterium]|nr:S-layer homology domain-containing protein [Bacillota bacterium]MBQ6810132.1 S-layer homology domain-containing protein [Bacillota bacterium]